MSLTLCVALQPGLSPAGDYTTRESTLVITLNPTERAVLRSVQAAPSTVRELTEITSLNRTQVYRQLVSLQYKGYIQPVVNSYPTVWKYVLGASY